MKIPRWKLTCLGVSVGAITAFGQTTIDLRTQIRNPDLSRYSGTKPLQSGSTLPGSCGVGELFFKTAATAGMNLYGCTGTAQWSLLGNALHAATHRHGGSDEVGSATPTANAIPKADGSGRLAAGWLPDLSGSYQPLLGFAPLSRTANLSDLSDPSAARTSLGLGAAALKTVSGSGTSLFSASGSFAGNAIPSRDSSGALVDSGCAAANGVLTCGTGAPTRIGVRQGTAPADTVLNGAANDAIFFLDSADGNWKMRKLDGTVMTLSGAATITSFVNAPHAHNSAAGGGFLDESAFHFTDVTTGNATAATHGLLPKLPNNAGLCFRGDGTFGACASPGGSAGQIQVNLNGAFSGLNPTGSGVYVVTSPATPSDGCAQFSGGNLGSTGSPCGSGGTTAVSAGTVAGAVYCADTSVTANAVVCSPATAFPASYAAGQTIFVRIAQANTGPVTVDVANLGARSVTRNGSAALSGGELAAGGIYRMTYDGSVFLVETAPASARAGAAIPACAASAHSGTAESCSTAPSFIPSAGDTIVFQAAVVNAGPFTLDVNSSGAKPVIKNGSAALAAGDLLASPFQTVLVYDGANWEMQGQAGNAAAAGGLTAGNNIGISGSTISFDPLDSSAFTASDEFIPSGGGVGQWGWTSSNIGTSGCASAFPSPGLANHPYLYQFTTASSGANLGCSLNLDVASNVSGQVLSGKAGWEYRWIARLDTAASVRYRIGTAIYTGYNADPPANGFWLRYDAAADSTLKWEMYNGGAQTGVSDTGITPNALAWYNLRVRSLTLGEYRASLRAGYQLTGASWSGGTATLTIGSPHTIAAGNVITVAGTTPGGYDGTYTVTATTATTVSYTLATNPGSYSSGGSALGAWTPEVTFCLSGCMVNVSAIPGSLQSPVAQVVSETNAAAKLTVDWFGMAVKGMAR